MKLKDLRLNLDEDINLQIHHPPISLSVEEDLSLNTKNTNEVTTNISHTITIVRNNSIRLKNFKNNTNFDSLQNLGKESNTVVVDDTETHEQIEKKTFQILAKKQTLVGALKNGLLKDFLLHKGNQITRIIKKNYTDFSHNKQHYFLGKIAASFLCLFILLLIDKVLVEYYTNSGYQKLQDLKDGNITNLHATVKDIKSDFEIANILFIPFNLIPSKQVANAHHMIQGGKETSYLLEKLYSFGKETYELSLEKGIENIMFSQLLENKRSFFLGIADDLEAIEDIYSLVDVQKSYPEIQIKLNKLQTEIKKVRYKLFTVNNNFDTLLSLLGHETRVKYMIVFQNNDEIRPQGGFMGSLAMIDLFRGQQKAFERNDVYFYEFKIKKEVFDKTLAPKGLDQLTPYLGLRDSNYYINHKDAGRNIKFFMKKAGYSIDGILYLNLNTLLEVLDFIGPFYSETLNQDITKENFSLIMSLLVESKVSKQGTMDTPKQILFDFMEEFKNQIQKEKKNYVGIAKILIKDIQKREMEFYHFGTPQRDLLENIGLYNPINYDESLDFSYPVFTSLSGNKSDRYTEISFTKSVQKNLDCSYENSLQIFINHNYSSEDELYFTQKFEEYNLNKADFNNLLRIQGKGTNKQYVRVILPKNIEVRNTNVGITDYDDRGKSIDFFMDTAVGESSQFTINYKVNNPECLPYSYSFYKQPGIDKYNLKINTESRIYDFVHQTEDLSIRE